MKSKKSLPVVDLGVNTTKSQILCCTLQGVTGVDGAGNTRVNLTQEYLSPWVPGVGTIIQLPQWVMRSTPSWFLLWITCWRRFCLSTLTDKGNKADWPSSVRAGLWIYPFYMLLSDLIFLEVFVGHFFSLSDTKIKIHEKTIPAKPIFKSFMEKCLFPTKVQIVPQSFP